MVIFDRYTHLVSFLEYVPGGSIGRRLRDHGKFNEEVTKLFTGQILEGLEYLHSKNIIHRVSLIFGYSNLHLIVFYRI